MVFCGAPHTGSVWSTEWCLYGGAKPPPPACVFLTFCLSRRFFSPSSCILFQSPNGAPSVRTCAECAPSVLRVKEWGSRKFFFSSCFLSIESARSDLSACVRSCIRHEQSVFFRALAIIECVSIMIGYLLIRFSDLSEHTIVASSVKTVLLQNNLLPWKEKSYFDISEETTVKNNIFPFQFITSPRAWATKNSRRKEKLSLFFFSYYSCYASSKVVALTWATDRRWKWNRLRGQNHHEV